MVYQLRPMGCCTKSHTVKVNPVWSVLSQQGAHSISYVGHGFQETMPFNIQSAGMWGRLYFSCVVCLRQNVDLYKAFDRAIVLTWSTGSSVKSPRLGDIIRHGSLQVCQQLWQDCFLQKEARVCVSNAFVIEDSKFKWCFCCGRWASDRGSRYANVNIVVEWKGVLAEGTVVWNE